MNIFRSKETLFFLIYLSSTAADAGGLHAQCDSYLLDSRSAAVSVAVPETDFITNSTFQIGFLNLSHNTNYDIEVAPFIAKDQCQTGHCHLYTWLSQLEQSSGISLSEDYLDVMNIYHIAINALKNGTTKLHFASNPVGARAAILSYGLMPLGSWTPIHKPNSKKVYSKIITGLESILLNSKLKNLEKSRVETLILNFIQSIVGVWPSYFTFNDESFNPRSFADKYFNQLNRTLVTAIRTKEPQSISFPESVTFPRIEILKHQIEFENLLMSVLDKGKPAYLSYNHHDQFIDSEIGIMSISAFNFPGEAVITSPEVISENYLWKGPHAVLVIGYQKGPMTGRPIKWKILNSWGSDAGDNGFFHMYSDYFQLHAWSFSFIDD